MALSKKPVNGMKDILPAEMEIRDYVTSVIKDTYRSFGFTPIEDLTGTVEVIIFPRDYERYQRYLQDDAKIFVIGHATVEDEQNGKIICE